MKTPYILVGLEAVELDTSKPLFFDIETIGLYGKVRLAQFYQEGDDHVQMVENPNPYALAALVNKHHMIAHNAHYETTTIQQQTETRWIPAKMDDTFLLARLFFYTQEKFALDAVMKYTLGFDPYEKQHLDKKVLQKSNWAAGILSEQQLQYAATDVYYMPQVWHKVKASREEFSYKLDMLTLGYCLDFQWNGMPVNKDQLMARHRANEKELLEMKLPINSNSYVQVRKYLDSTESDDIALAKMEINGNEKAKAVRRNRKLRKQQSFLGKFDTRDGRIYGKFKPSARSGRLTSDDQNLQQLPRALKDCFEASDGRVLIYSDYAQLELRTICAITGCTTMEELFRKGEDLHGFTAQMVFGDDWGKLERQNSKTYNFNFLYGGGISMVQTILIKQAMILLSEEQGYQDRRKWRNLWKEIYAWQQRGIRAFQAGRPGSTPLGRKYKAKMMTDQLNIENQGAGAEVAKLALHYLAPKILAYNEQHDTDFMLCNFIHDSFIVEGPDDPAHYKAMAILIAESMQDAWFECCGLFQIKDLPMPVQVMVGTNWGAIEDDDEPNIWDYELEGMALCKTSK